MGVSRAVILAAGQGSRLRPLTDERPKCLLEVLGRTLMARQIDVFRRAGIADVVAVLGYRSEQVRGLIGPAVEYIDNPDYAHTNSLYSLWLARDWIAAGTLIVNSDVLAPTRLVTTLLDAPASDAVLVDMADHFEAEDMKVTVADGLAVDFGKDLPMDRAHAHNVGLAKFDVEGGALLAACLDRLVSAGRTGDWTTVAYRDFARSRPLAAVATGGLPWIEIDFADDLARAQSEIGPAVDALEALSSARR